MSQLKLWNGTSWVNVTDAEHRGASDPHTQYHNDTRGDARYYTISAMDSILAGVASSSHTHAASDIVSGTVATARLGSGTADSTTFLRGDQTWAVPAGGAAALGLWDWWVEQKFLTASAFHFLGAGIASGSGTATSSAGLHTAGYAPFGVIFQSHASNTNSGGRWSTHSASSLWFGAIGWKFRAQIYANNITDVTMRIGFHDSVNSSDAVDGVYFEAIGATLSAKTSNNSSRTTHGTTYTIATGNFYTLEIDVNAAGNEARYRVWANDSATAVMDVTNTTNIPTTSTRSTAPAINVTKSTAGVVQMVQLFSMGFGTIDGYNRARG